MQKAGACAPQSGLGPWCGGRAIIVPSPDLNWGGEAGRVNSMQKNHMLCRPPGRGRDLEGNSNQLSSTRLRALQLRSEGTNFPLL